MKKLFHIFCLVCFLPLLAAAQQKTISGRVTDAQTGAALVGVSVAAGTNAAVSGATTDANGQFSITVPSSTTQLVFSFVGMRTVVETLNDRTVLNITLLGSDDQMSNVVVVGYGTKRKETLTGSVSNISNKEIQTSVNVSLAQKLQGKVAGLQIRQLGGEPGNFDNSIVIRGYGGNPLYVIDGIIREGPSEFQRLNPDDIESISFLKDASAAIYGFGAANGVVIVTTKKGKSGKATFSYNGAVGFMQPTDVPKMMNASQWMQIRNEAEIFSTGSPFISNEELQKYISGEYPSTDWYDVSFNKTAMQHSHNLSASGGSEKTQYYMGLGFFDEGSFLKTKDLGYKRYNFRTNITTELVKNLKAEVFFAGRYDKKYAPGENFFNIFKGTRVTLPTEQPYANGNPDYPAVVTPSNQNPLILTDKGITGYSETINRNIQLSGALTWEVPFVRGLQIRGLASYDMNNYQGKDVSKPYDLYTYAGGEYIVSPQRVGTGAISNNNGNSNQLTLQAQANYSKTIARLHNLAATVVFEQRQNWDRGSYLRRFYDFYTIDQIDRASENNMSNSGNEGQSASQSLLGRINYDFDKKYLLELAFRYQGTSLFPPETRWGLYPVASAAWRISEEKFMRGLPWVSNLKLRGSYGEVASSENVQAFQWIPGFGLGGTSRYEFENGALTIGATAPGIVNPNLTWIKAKTSDIGIDIGLFNNKFTLEMDVYRRDQTGYPAYRDQTIPNTFGASLPQENLNSYRVQGIEFTIGHSNRIGQLGYNISANFNYSRTRRMYVEESAARSSWDRWRNKQTDRYNDVIWGYTYLGQFQTEEEIANYALQNGDQANIRELPGDFKFADINNDGVIDGKDERPLFLGANGNNNDLNPAGKAPKINYGMTIALNYKGFDVNLLFQGAAMYTVRFNEVYAEVMAFRGNTPAYFFDRWHKADPYNSKSEWVPGTWPAARFNFNVGSMYKESSVWRKDASYLRLKNVELGYTVPARIYRGTGINKIRVYGSAFNLITWADPFVKAFDPERLEGLFNAGFNYPLTKTYNFGINVNF